MSFIDLLQQSAIAQYYLAVLVCLWPVQQSLYRMGLPRLLAAVLLVPLAGFALVMLAAALRKWPKLPPQPPRPKREKRA